jgi:hypothetical protein
MPNTIRRFPLALTACLCGALDAQLPQAGPIPGDLLVNGDFGQNAVGWTLIGPGWSINSGTVTLNLASLATVAIRQTVPNLPAGRYEFGGEGSPLSGQVVQAILLAGRRAANYQPPPTAAGGGFGFAFDHPGGTMDVSLQVWGLSAAGSIERLYLRPIRSTFLARYDPALGVDLRADNTASLVFLAVGAEAAAPVPVPEVGHGQLLLEPASVVCVGLALPVPVLPGVASFIFPRTGSYAWALQALTLRTDGQWELGPVYTYD